MAAYPPSLPEPSAFPFSPRDRRAGSSQPGLTQLRGRSREQIVDAKGVRWSYSPEQMAVWLEWYQNDLQRGQLWFAVTLPGRGGWLTRMARFVGPVRREHIGGGYFELTADLEVSFSRRPVANGAGSILLDATYEDDTSDVTDAPQATDSVTNPEHVSVSGGRLSLELTSGGSGSVSYAGGKLGTVTDEETTIEVVGFQCGSPFGGLGGGSNWRFVLAHSASYQASFGAVVTGGTAYLTTMLISNVGEFGGNVQTHDVLQDGNYKIVFDPVAETIKWLYGNTVIRTFERGVYAQVGGIISCAVGITNSITGPAPTSYSYDRVLVYAGAL